jgi:hypothetical protein
MPFQPDNPAYTGKAGSAMEISPDDLMRGAQNAKKDIVQSGPLLMFVDSLMIPGGAFVQELLGLFMGATEYAKGNKKTAAFISVLSLIPFVSQLRKLTPTLNNLGKEGIATLSSKLSGTNKIPLTTIEHKAVNELSYNIEPIKNSLTKIEDAVKSTVDYKGKYIRTYGKVKFQDLFNKLIKGEINKQQYINELVGGLENTYNKVKFTTIAGVKFSEVEMEAITDLSKQILNTDKNSYEIKLIINGVEKEIPIKIASYVQNGEPVLWDAVADRIGGKILVNYQKVKSMSLEKLTNTLSHECAHLKDLSFTSKKMTDQYTKIVNVVQNSSAEVQNALKQFGASSPEYNQAYAKYAKYFTKYQYHYREMLANNSKVLQSLSRNARDLIGQFGVPETQKMIRTMKDGLKRGVPQNIDYYLGKLIGKDNAEYIRQIRVYDKNLYQDLLKKLSKQIDYMEEQLKLYQQI